MLANLVVIERFQTNSTVVRLYWLGCVAPWFRLSIHFGLQGRHSLQDILFRKELWETRNDTYCSASKDG